jgi:hypothetical protein
MNTVESVSGFCPYCGERVVILVDASEGDQQYTEDCEVCCQPMVVAVAVAIAEEETVTMRLYSENDAF